MNLGQAGEEMAAKHLERTGWTVLARNARPGLGELDIVCRDPSGTLVFVEVKTMQPGQLQPEHHLTTPKLKRVVRAAEVFIAKHPRLIRDSGWRVDAMAVVLTKDKKIIAIRSYQNVAAR